jgi:hypothetical protein
MYIVAIYTDIREFLQAAGADLIVASNVGTSLVVANNRAKMGGGIAFMGAVSLGGEGVSQVHGNLASENGGGLYGFSSYARLNAASEHMLSIQVWNQNERLNVAPEHVLSISV